MTYEIDASLVGETVTMRYNPADQGDIVEVCHNGQFVQKAKLVDIYANCFVKRDRPSCSMEQIVENRTSSKKNGEKKSEPNHTVNFTQIAIAKGEQEGTDV